MVQTSFIAVPSIMGTVRRAPAVFLFVTLWKYKVCDNGNAMKQCYFQKNYGAIACRKVCNCAPIFNFLLWNPRIFHYGKIYTKNYNFSRFGGL